MGTRLESVFAEVIAEMGVDENHEAYASYSHWGKRAAEARKSVPWITWVEEDDGERIVAPRQNESASEPVCAVREVPVVISVGAQDPETSEDIFHSLLAAIERAFTSRAYAWGEVEKGGERPNSSHHVRNVRVVFRVPITVEERMVHKILTTTMAVETTDYAGEDPEIGVP
jgi:hypothetical protein